MICSGFDQLAVEIHIMHNVLYKQNYSKLFQCVRRHLYAPKPIVIESRNIKSHIISVSAALTHFGIMSLKISPDCMNVQICQMSRDMRFPTMWYVQPAKAQTSMRIRAV